MSFRSKLGQAILPAILLAGLALPAAAHPGHEAGGFAAGFAHPFGGLDHLLAMLAVGLWAIQQSVKQPRALWLLPVSFVAAMAAGFGLGIADVMLPGVEAGIALSVLILGLIVAFAARPPLPAAMAVTVLFALFHGHAHATEMGGANMLAAAAGMLLATALLHGLGVAGARLTQRMSVPVLTRAAGAAVAVAGVVILVA